MAALMGLGLDWPGIPAQEECMPEIAHAGAAQQTGLRLGEIIGEIRCEL